MMRATTSVPRRENEAADQLASEMFSRPESCLQSKADGLRQDDFLCSPKSRLNDFAAASGGWFWETDERHRFSYLSPSIETATGVACEWHYGKTREELGVTETLEPGVWQEHRRILAQNLPFSDFIFPRNVPDGCRWMRTSGIPKFDGKGRFVCYRGTAQDITAEVKEKKRAERLTNAIQGLDELFVLWDADDRLVVCNQRFREMNIKVIETTEPGTLFADHIRAALNAGLFPQAAGREEEWFRGRIAHHRKPGNPIEIERQTGHWLLLSEQKLPDGSTVTRSTDISEQKRMERSLRNMAFIDPLTAVYNRRKFTEIADKIFSNQVPSRSKGLIIFDVDHFKQVNDRYGHVVGDEALALVARAAKAELDGDCTISRIGGEEFVVLLPNHDADTVRSMAERIRCAVECLQLVSGEHTLKLTVSLGALSVGESKAPLVDILTAADKLLYRAKRQGRNLCIHQNFDDK